MCNKNFEVGSFELTNPLLVEELSHILRGEDVCFWPIIEITDWLEIYQDI
jgi:hypothetical protein